MRHYLAFVERCQRPDGRFRNFMAADGTWLEEAGSEDAQGRAVWALGFAALRSQQTEVRLRALRVLDLALPRLMDLTFPRARAFALLGLDLWRRAERGPALDETIDRLASQLAALYQACADDGWRWFEDVVTYCNARLPQALLATPHQSIGLDSLAWLCGELEVDGCLRLVGNRGWYPRGGRPAVYDQQAIDAAATLSACASAYQLSGDDRFRRWAGLCFDWFQGRNSGNRSLLDLDTGGCCDGLEEGGVNHNQGAESLLAWLLAQEDMQEMGWA